jgi:small subunit ribosomal protein S17
MAENSNNKTGKRRRIDGIVVSNAMDKTVRVKVSYPTKHPVYKKTVIKSKVFFARCTDEKPAVGETVTIEESRPYSKNVKWKVIVK